MGTEGNNVPPTAPDHPHRLDLPHYPTFQGVTNYPPPQPVIGFPQPFPPPGSADPPPPPPRPPPYAPRYRTVPGFAVTEGRSVRERPLRCCGFECGWFLFISGFFLVGIPWLVAAMCLLCNQHRIGVGEKPGYVASVITGIVAIIAIVLGVTKGTHVW